MKSLGPIVGVFAFVLLCLLLQFIAYAFRRVGVLKRLRNYIRQTKRLLVRSDKRKALLWSDLKQTFNKLELQHGIYEKEMAIQLQCRVGEDDEALFEYQITDYSIRYQVYLLNGFPEECTTDLFIMATHYNNLLSRGTVMIDTSDNTVQYLINEDFLSIYLCPEDLVPSIISQHHIIRDLIYPGFRRLLIEGEAPAIIIADLLEKNEENRSSSSESE